MLAPGGAALVYDFSPGRSFRDWEALDEWFAEFERRYPRPKGEAREINPEILAGLDRRFKVREHARFEIRIRLDREFYAGYMMTETNVALAIRRGLRPGGFASGAAKRWGLCSGMRLGRFCSAAILSGWRGSRNDSDRCAGPAGRQPCLTEQRGRAFIRLLP